MYINAILRGNELDSKNGVLGAGVISEHQLKDRVDEINDSRVTLKKQIRVKVQRINDNTVNVPESQQIDAFCKQAQKVLSSLSFNSKQEILRNVLEKVIAAQEKIEGYGYLPIQEGSYVELKSINRNNRTS